MNDNDEEAIFSAAIEIENLAERDQYLRKACANNPAARASIDQLLSMHDTDHSFLETPAIASVVGLREEEAGQLIDRYCLDRQIGEGGFGVVWKAMQQEPVRRPVAIKIIRADVATERLVARFELERQTLALMNHPNIATVFDAGTTPGGHPYFVMELVEGESIDQYANSNRLNVRQRVGMLIDVCRAVHHAHKKGIIHRDLKPSNILVADIDGSPCIKMIDFGIAKALRDEHEGVDPNHERPPEINFPDLTADQLIAGTPQFMSPEQFCGSVDIDSVADVYALGGIAYQLMTGVAPFESDHRTSIGQLRELVCGDELPINPSMRDCPPQCVASAQLRGDLDAIILKAVNRDRTARYQSASELADDFQRFLDHEPVVAVERNALYVLGKFSRRYRATAWAAILALVSIIVGAASVTHALFRAQAAQRIAEKERRGAEQERINAEREREMADQMREIAESESTNAKQVAALLKEMLGASDPQRGLPANYTIGQQVDVFAEKLKNRADMVSNPSVKADLYRTIGRSYLALRNLQRAESHLKEALTIREQLYSEDDRKVLESRLDYAQYLLFSQQRRALQWELKRLIPVLRSTGNKDLLVQTLIFSGSTQVSGNRSEALPAATEALIAAQEFHGKDHWITLVQQGRVASQTAALASQTADLDSANSVGKDDPESQATLAVETLMTRWPDHRFEIALARSQLARIFYLKNKLVESEREYRLSIETFSDLLGDGSVYAQRDFVGLAQTLFDLGRSDEAIRIAKNVIDLAELSPEENGRLPSRAFHTLALILYEKEPENAEAILRRSVAAQRRASGDVPATVRQFRTQANKLISQERYSAAQLVLEECLDIHRVMGNRNGVNRVLRDLQWLTSSREDSADGEPSQ